MTSSKDVIAVQDTAIKKISLQLLLSGEDDDSTGGMKRGGGGVGKDIVGLGVRSLDRP
jgi:hypothetical protein